SAPATRPTLVRWLLLVARAFRMVHSELAFRPSWAFRSFLAFPPKRRRRWFVAGVTRSWLLRLRRAGVIRWRREAWSGRRGCPRWPVLLPCLARSAAPALAERTKPGTPVSTRSLISPTFSQPICRAPCRATVGRPYRNSRARPPELWCRRLRQRAPRWPHPTRRTLDGATAALGHP